MQIGILGIGKMGTIVLDKLLKGGHTVVAWNKTKEVYDQFKISHSEYLISNHLKFSFSVEGMREVIMKPRVFWLMLPTPEETEEIISQISYIAEPGDIIVDAGDANYKDTQKRFESLSTKGLKFLGIGVAGGTFGAEAGFCLSVGGNKDGYEYIKPLLDSLAAPEGAHNYFGEGGAGHFVKMVHNGIEYGMMQSLGEGFGVLHKSNYALNLLDVASLWQRGSILRSFLLDMTANSLVSDPDFINRDGFIQTTGETKWMIDSAAEEHVPADTITKALEFRQHSQYDKATQNTLAAKLVAALRRQFSAHEEKKET